jgi:hypothetical protein
VRILPSPNLQCYGAATNRLSVVVGKMMRVDSAWIAVIGTAAGAGVTGVVGIGKAVVEALSARSQRKHDSDQAKAQRDAEKADKDAQREHERLTALRKSRWQQISSWREGLALSASAYQKFAAVFDDDNSHRNASARLLVTPNVVGDAWFQSLRPHLSDEFRTQSVLRCDAELVVKLGDEIDRVQRGWAAESEGS